MSMTFRQPSNLKRKRGSRVPETDEYQEWQEGFGSPTPERPPPSYSL